MRHLLLKIALAVVAVLLHASISFACSCLPALSVLEDYEQSQVVMIVRVVSVQRVGEKPRRSSDDGVQSSKLVVEKVYKGNVRVGEELTFAQGNGADCVWIFDEGFIGKRSLLYTNVPAAGSLWRAFVCGRSTSLESASEDLLYFDKLDQVRGKTRVSGRYAGGGFARQDFPVAGRKIQIVGEKQIYQITTDEKGIFEIYDLPPGNYRLEPELPTGYKIDRDWLRVVGDANREQSSDTFVAFTLKPQKHVSLALGFEPKDNKPARPK